MAHNYDSFSPMRSFLVACSLTALFTLFMGSSLLMGQGFQRTYGGPNDEVMGGLVLTPDGGFALISRTNSYGSGNDDAYLLKFNAGGGLQWSRTFGGNGNENGVSVANEPGGGYVLTGWTDTYGAGLADNYIIRTNAAGVVTWVRSFGGDVDDIANHQIVEANGDYVFCGYSNSLIWGPGGSDFMLTRVNNAGATQWSYVYGDTANEFPAHFQQTPAGGYMVSGYRRNYVNTTRQAVLMNMDSLGALQWMKRYDGGADDQFQGLVATADSGWVISGFTQSGTAGDRDAWLIKVDSVGDVVWSNRYGGAGDDRFLSVVATSDGGYAALGTTNSFGAGGSDLFLVKVNAAGTLQWARVFGGAGNESTGSSRTNFYQLPGGGFQLGGSTTSFGAAGQDIYIVRTDANGFSGCNEATVTPTVVPVAMTVVADTMVVQAAPVGANALAPTTNPTPTDSFLCCNLALALADTAYLCPGDTLTLDAGLAGAFYNWNTTATTQTITVTTTGTYFVTVTDTNGCSTTDTTIVVPGTPLGLSFNATNVSCIGGDGTIQAVVTGGTGSYAYSWSPGGQTTDTLQNLGPGTYVVTVTDTGTVPLQDTVFFDDFETGPTAWTLNTPTGINALQSNIWVINDDEGGMPVGSCGMGNNGDETMHITCTSANCGTLLTGALYNATEETNVRAETPNISTIGRTNMTLEFTFISNGDSLLDNASVLYSTDGGLTWNVLDNSIKSNVCITLQGEWALATYALPAACENIANLRIGFNWTNNADNLGTDPSVAINNVLITRPVAPINGCTVTDSVTLTAGSLSLTMDSTNVTCFGDSNGTAKVTVGGGSGNYVYLWQPGGQTTDSIGGLAPGTYTVFVTDTSVGGPTTPTLDTLFFDDFEAAVTTWILNTPTGVNAATNNIWVINDDEGGVLPPACGTANNGDETMHITCTSAFCGSLLTGALYNATQESNVRTETQNISTLGRSNLELDFDFISLGDGLLDNCSVQYSINGGVTWNVLDPSIKTVNCITGQGQWAARNYALPATCNNIPNLRIGFNWTNNADNSGSDPSIALNNVLVTSRDSTSGTGSCTDSATVMIVEPTALSLVIAADSSTCGDSTGQAYVAVTGGTPGYSYLWNSNPAQTGDTAFTLPAGNYQVVVSDTNGCQDSASTQVFNLNGATATILASQDPTCTGFSDGYAVVEAVGGTAPFTITWRTSPAQTTDTAFGLSAGIYTVVVSDSSGCEDSTTVTINDPGPVPVSFIIEPATCGQNNGAAVALPGGNGTPPYTYLWNTTPASTNDTITGLAVGSYSVTVTDSNGCTGTNTALVDSLTPPSVSVTNVQDVSCAGLSNGTATATVTGGAGTLNYAWSSTPPQLTAQLSGVSTGTYTVVVQDSAGCIDSASVLINEPALLVVNLITSGISCNGGGSDGSASVTVSGGAGNYTYLWSSGGSGTSVSNLPPGPISVTVTDGNGCSVSQNGNIGAQGSPIVDAGPNVTFCEGDGGVGLIGSASGGSPGYHWTWWCDSTNTNCGLSFPFTPSPNANPTVSTTYFVQVVDTNGCVSNIDSVEVTILPKPIVDAGPDIDLCFPNAPCEILTPSVSNAPGPYTYNWSPGIGLNDSTIATPCARPNQTTIYSLQVTASNGCASDVNTLDTVSTVTVFVNPTPVANAGPDVEICAGDSIRLQGFGSNSGPNYRFQWTPHVSISDSSVQNPLVWPSITTDYSLVVYSTGNCPSFADTVRVTVHTNPTASAGNVADICLGETALLDGDAWGDSTATYTYTWTPSTGVIGDTTVEDLLVSPESTTTYYVQATTNYGCNSPLDSVLVQVKPTPFAEAGPPFYVCPNDGGATLQGSYYYTTTDTAPDPTQIRYNWTPSGTLTPDDIAQPFANPDSSTWYTLTVSYNTCSHEDSVLVTVHPDFGDSVWADTTIICGSDSVQLYAIGGLGGADFTWFPPYGLSDPNIANPLASPDSTTTYTMILEEGGCFDTLSLTINVFPQPDVAFLTSQTEGCEDFTVSFLEVAANSTAYIWNFGDGSPVNNQANPTHTYVDPGTYFVTLAGVGAGGCKTLTDGVPITVYPAPTPDFTSDPAYPVELALPGTTVQFFDQTSNPNAVAWLWDFGDGNTSTDQNPVHTYVTAGTYQVSLTVNTDEGCQETVVHGPYVIKEPELFIPNVFTPNGDGNNDVFLVEYTGSQPFYLTVMDRWGTVMYKTNDKLAGWQGLTNLNVKAQPGVYFYTVKIGKREFAGNVSLIR